jgi:hypothetical protein
MHGEVTEFRGLCATLAQHRRISVGEPLDTSFLASWPADVQSSADFAGLVSAAYQMWRENWKLDIGFLLGHRRDGAARDFDRLIYQLRTAQQHADNSEAIARSTLWTRDACAGRDPATADDWLSCGTALMTALNAGVRVLCQTAARRDKSFRSAWEAKVSETPEAAVTRVADDLGLRLSQWQRQNHALRVAGRWKNYRLGPGEDATDVLASFAEEAIVSRVEPLPCSYQDVLAELGMLGSPDAVSALHLAHAVAEITSASGDAYLKRLKEAWAFLLP